MPTPDPARLPSRLHRTIALGAICIGVSALGLFLARPIAARFQHSAPWVLPAIAVGILVAITIVALVVLPRLSSRGG